ncbi:deoxynucleoside triphosphate triphosphohydrolase SAMHD1-like [Stegastes partitus]|uniref:Deoxynucleoside triphosphate triphosphohydrolase SAMHD1-like n=1 Tax=Stegastes partitus TaxID=144197 RepID=A0A9Y4KM46_9TELE|nr:PREDICTED: deoxynucleoside triphosphate triphosphohydrolase SAMHD1-like [Stegastes partitus]
MDEYMDIFLDKKATKEDVIQAKNNITAVYLRDATIADLASLGIDKKLAEEILCLIRECWKTTVQGKVFNDPVHGHVEFHPLLIKIIDTPQFQRLRYIKHLGGVGYVFPGASHSRYEHSIGVGYLAGQLAQALRTKQEDLDITPEDILCVQIAGLCHDLGHGPFSKVFEEIFLPQKCCDWKSKKASADMFDHLVKSNGLEKVMKDYKLDLPKDLEFIKEMIQGPEDTQAVAQSTWPYKGRTKDKSFLYEIVANEKNGIDVVKFDYLARDCYHLGIPQGFDYRRCLVFARVCRVNSERHICFRDKELDNLCNMFHTRSYLHRKAYQHRATKIIEVMISDAFSTADEHIQIEGSGGEMFTLSTAKNDMEAYTKLTDHVFEKILYSPSNPPEVIKMLQKELEETGSQTTDPYMEKKKEIIDKALKSSEEMAQARQILHRITTRKTYKFLGERDAERPTEELIKSWKNQLAIFPPAGDTRQVTLRPEDLEIVHFNIGHGKQHEAFISNTYFYTKRNPNRPFRFPRDKVLKHLPKLMSEQFIGVYCKNSDNEVVEAAQKKFDQWDEKLDSQDGGKATPENIT